MLSVGVYAESQIFFSKKHVGAKKKLSLYTKVGRIRFAFLVSSHLFCIFAAK